MTRSNRRPRRFLTGLALGSGTLALCALLLSPALAKDEKEKAGKDLFEMTKVHEFHLEVEAKEYDKLPARGGMRFPGAPPAPPKPAEKEEDKPTDVHKGGGFGLEFPWVHGTFTAGGTAYKNVGLRYKGNASYMASTRSAKRNFKVALEHYEEEQRFQGLKTVNLNAGALDPTRAREALSYAVFRAAGVPAPRTSFARVTITVPGKYDKELLGLYTVVEQVDKSFLKSRFKKNTGLLMKPERLRGLEYLGDDWDKYKDRYNPKHEPSKEEAKRFMDFLKLLNKGSDEEFRKEIAGYLDVDEFLRFVAVNAMVVNLDSFLMLGHNYYIYLNPENDKIVFIPWDLDLSLASFGMAGSPEQQVDLSLTHPYPGENKLIDRLLAMPEMKEKYQKILKELSENAFSKDNLLKDFDAIDKAVKEPIDQEKKAAAARKETGGGGFGPGPVGRGMDLRAFLEKRSDAVVAQVAGKSKGYVPTGGFGFGRPGIGNQVAKPLLEALDADKDSKLTKEELVAGVKKFFSECDKDKKGSLDEKQLAEGLKKILPPRPAFGPPPGPGQTTEAQLATAIMKRAGKDGKVALDDLVAAAEKLFTETDKDKKEKLEEKQVADAINVLVPPRGFGPGGFGLGNFVARPLMEALDGDKDGKLTKEEAVAGVKKFFADCDKDKKGSLDEKQLVDGLKKILPPRPAFGPPPAPGQTAEAQLAAAILKRAGKDGKVALDDLVAAVEAPFKDKEKLEERDVAGFINALLPPPNFGPPGPRPEPKKEP